jgi:holo-[acyl-carrier protein] synthase
VIPLRTGIDLVEISRLESLEPAIRSRFLERVFTPRELEEAGGRFPSLSGVFAAKEAVAKALGTGIGPVSWQEIEILQAENGQPILVLHGSAIQAAAGLCLSAWSVSISHTHTLAMAVAVATGEDPGKQPGDCSSQDQQ